MQSCFLGAHKSCCQQIASNGAQRRSIFDKKTDSCTRSPPGQQPMHIRFGTVQRPRCISGDTMITRVSHAHTINSVFVGNSCAYSSLEAPSRTSQPPQPRCFSFAFTVLIRAPYPSITLLPGVQLPAKEVRVKGYPKRLDSATPINAERCCVGLHGVNGSGEKACRWEKIAQPGYVTAWTAAEITSSDTSHVKRTDVTQKSVEVVHLSLGQTMIKKEMRRRVSIY